ncbi:hypothetical protein N431DRAFT_480264 [Stipitochalara longipes BDJ]|nr:hypothetical protein N431DRAFT_480264 [Stipitochalara longipes BDJ]
MDRSKGSSSAPGIANIRKEKRENSLSPSKPPSQPKGKRNIMLERFQKFQTDDNPSLAQYTYEPKPLFFYGTLADPLQLQEVFQLPAPPVFIPARASSYKVMLWGQYPALVNGTPDNFVDGMAFAVEAQQQ